jgi:hypothetical protein
MNTHIKLLLAASVVALALGVAVGIASANRMAINLEPARPATFRAVWADFIFAGAQTSSVFTCALTLEGSFHSKTISKVSESLIGYVTSAMMGNCNARVLSETLPWHVRYRAFFGALPNIEAVVLRVIGFTLSAPSGIFGSCLYASTAASPLQGTMRMSRGTAEAIQIAEEHSIPLSVENLACPSAVDMEGTTSSLTLLGTTEKIRLLLVQ